MNPCTASAPCASFDRAYAVALPGQVVEVAGGRYAVQTVLADPAKAVGADVVFQPAAGASVSVAYAYIQASHLEFRDMRMPYEVEGTSPRERAVGVTLRNITSVGTQVEIQTAADVQVIGGEISGVSDGSDGMKIQPQFGVGSEPRDVLIDGLYIHDLARPDSTAHTDCLQVGGVRDLSCATRGSSTA